MNYLKYYNILRLHIPTKKGLGFMIIFVILYIIQTDVFFTDANELELGYSFLMIISVFVISMYAYQIRCNPTHPMYQFPLSSKQRVKYDYIGVFFTFISITVGFTLFGMALIGLFYVFGANMDVTNTEDPFYMFGSIYQIAYIFMLVSVVMPLSYIESIKHRYIVGVIAFIVLGLVNFIIIWLLSGNMVINGDMKVLIENTSYGYILAISFLVISLLAIYQSYKISTNLNKY